MGGFENGFGRLKMQIGHGLYIGEDASGNHQGQHVHRNQEDCTCRKGDEQGIGYLKPTNLLMSSNKLTFESKFVTLQTFVMIAIVVLCFFLVNVNAIVDIEMTVKNVTTAPNLRLTMPMKVIENLSSPPKTKPQLRFG